jgi:hypothetical protein
MNDEFLSPPTTHFLSAFHFCVRISDGAARSKFVQKGELLNETEARSRKSFTCDWLDRSLKKDREQVLDMTIHPEQNSLLQVPRAHLDQCIELVTQHIFGANSRLVSKINETGCSD